MTKEEAIKYLQQLYPNGGHCWLDEQRIEAIGMAIKALQEEPVSEDLGKENKIEILADIIFNAAKHGYMPYDTQDEDCAMEIAKRYIDKFITTKKQENPVSEDLETELDKYIKDNFTIDKEQLNRFGIEEKDYMYSMDKSDMEKMVRYFTGNYKIPVSDDLEEAAKLYISDSLCITGEEDWDDAAIEALNAYKAGAKWQKEQDQSTIELAEDHAMFAGMEKMKEELMAKAIDAQCFGFQGAALFSFKLPADNYLVGSKIKVIIIKED